MTALKEHARLSAGATAARTGAITAPPRASRFSPVVFSDAASAAAYAYEMEDAQAETTAERMLGAILRLAPYMHRLRKGEELPHDAGRAPLGSLQGLRLGIIGPQAAHRALADRLRGAFGMAISCCCASEAERAKAEECGYHVTEDVEALLEMADVVVAVDKPSRGGVLRVDNKALNRMQPHAILIADAAAVETDQMALAHALWFETIAGAGFVRSSGSKLWPEVEKAHNVVVV